MEMQYLNAVGCCPQKQSCYDYIEFEEDDDLTGNWEGQAYTRKTTPSAVMGSVNRNATFPATKCNCPACNPEMGNILKDIGNGISNAAKAVVNVVKDVGQKIADVATNVADAVVDSVKVVASRIGTIAKTIVHTFAQIFPGTVLIRTAFLTAMKLNILNIARRLRWAYTPKDWFVSTQGGDPAKYDKLTKVKNRIEDIFYWAGGKIENVEEAIKTGKGNNKDSIDWGAFSGFGSIEVVMDTRPLDASMSMREILGERMFNEEVSRGNLDGSVTTLGELGEPITATIATIMPILTALTTLLSKIGALKGSGAANPALTSDMDPSLTTAPENNINDMDYVNSYTSGMQNVDSNLAAFSDVQSEIDSNNTVPLPTLKPLTAESIKARLLNLAKPPVSAPAIQPQTSSDTVPVTQVSYTEPVSTQTSPSVNNGNNPPATKDNWFKRNQTAILVTTGIVAVGGVTWAVIVHNKKLQKQKLLQSHRLNGPARKRRPTSTRAHAYNF